MVVVMDSSGSCSSSTFSTLSSGLSYLFFGFCKLYAQIHERNSGYFLKEMSVKTFFVVKKNIYYVKLYYFMIFIAKDSLKFTHV